MLKGNQTGKGSLEVICGPMFAGKSEELIRRLRRAQIAKQRVAVFKHSIDDRYDAQSVTSHNGTKLKAHATESSSEILEIVSKNNYNVIGIDEVQFYSSDIIDTIQILCDRGVRVIVAGLDLDYKRVPFGPTPTLLALANSVTKLSAICTECGKEAYYSKRIVNDSNNDSVILVGAEEGHVARCRPCYLNPDDSFQSSQNQSENQWQKQA